MLSPRTRRYRRDPQNAETSLLTLIYLLRATTKMHSYDAPRNARTVFIYVLQCDRADLKLIGCSADRERDFVFTCQAAEYPQPFRLWMIIICRDVVAMVVVASDVAALFALTISAPVTIYLKANSMLAAMPHT